MIVVARTQEVTDIVPVIQQFGHETTRDKKSPVFRNSAIKSYLVERPRGGHCEVAVSNFGDMGNVNSAAKTCALATQYPAALIIFCGIAGSLDPLKARLGDVFIPSMVHSRYHSKIYDQPVPSPDHRSPDQCIDLLADRTIGLRKSQRNKSLDRVALDMLTGLPWTEIGNSLETRPLGAQFGDAKKFAQRDTAVVREDDIFSWEMVFDSGKYRDYLRNSGDLGGSIAVDMESFGFVSAIDALRSTGHPVAGIIIRGISDYVGHKGETDSEQGNNFRKIALKNAARVAVEIVKHVDLEALSESLAADV